MSGYFFFKKTTHDISSSFGYFVKYGLKIIYIYLLEGGRVDHLWFLPALGMGGAHSI
jgi:hypothetical protein